MKRYEIYYSWDSMGSNMERHEEESDIGDFVKYDEANKLLIEFADLLINPYDYSDRESDEIRERAEAYLKENK